MTRHRSRRSLFQITVVTVVSVLLPTGTARAGQCWQAPVEAPVSDPFRAPGCPWCPGHRGLEYDTSPGTGVRAVAGGVVTFAGTVAGTGYVVVRHADGLRTTYGNIRPGILDVGDLVVRGMSVGSTMGRLHFGVRRGNSYIDPAPLIGALIGVTRLIPTHGGRPAPAPAPRLRCPA